MASAAVQKGVDDILSVSSYTDPDNSSSSGSPHAKTIPSYMDQSRSGTSNHCLTPNFSGSPLYGSSYTKSISPDLMHTLTSNFASGQRLDFSETSTKDTTDDDSATESCKSLSRTKAPFVCNDIHHSGYTSVHNPNPDPPVTPGKSVKLAKDNVLRNGPTRGDKPDSTNVYKRTTENIENDRTCPLFSKTKKKRKERSRRSQLENSQTPITSKPVRPKTTWGCTRKQWLLLAVLLSGTLTSSFAVCLFPPFFPKIAQEKGATATIFGLIIGTNCLAAFIFTPIVGRHLQKIGVKFAFTMGMFCSGVCCILSGFLEWFPKGTVFIVMAILIRMVHAIANAGISTSTFAYIAVEFPDSVAKIFAFTRTTMNVAQMLGPVVGGALYTLGGFKMPFLVMGTIQSSMTLLALRCLEDYRDAGGKKNADDTSRIHLSRLFLIPGIWVAFLTFVFSTMSNGFLSVTLEPLVLRKFNLSPLYIGLMFGMKDGANSIASPIWGWACDKYRHVKVFILMSSCMAFTSFVFIGPLPWFPFESTLSIVIFSLTLNGIGIGGQQVAGVVDAMREAVCAGFPDDAGTHGCVAGLWASLSGAGRFTSRAGTGILVDHIGFRNATVVVVCLHGCIIIITMVYLIFCKEKSYLRFNNIESAPGLANVDVIDGGNRVGTIFTTTPSDAVTTKVVNIDAPSYREEVEDSTFLSNSPIPTPTRYAREGCKFYSSSESV